MQAEERREAVSTTSSLTPKIPTIGSEKKNRTTATVVRKLNMTPAPVQASRSPVWLSRSQVLSHSRSRGLLHRPDDVQTTDISRLTMPYAAASTVPNRETIRGDGNRRGTARTHIETARDADHDDSPG